MLNLLSLVKVYSVHTKYQPQRVLNDTPIIKLLTTTLINCGFCSKLFNLVFFSVSLEIPLYSTYGLAEKVIRIVCKWRQTLE